MNNKILILSWILRILVCLGFLLASSGKLASNPGVIEMFENWGYPDGFYFIVGILEFLLAILLLIPRTLKIAIIGLGIIMTGATITHICNDPVQEIMRPLIFAIFLAGIYYLNFEQKNKFMTP